MLKQEAIEQGVRFEKIAREILPLAFQIEEVLKRNGISCIASLTTEAGSGYFTFSTHENEWEMVRSGGDKPVKLRYSYSQEITLEEKPESVKGYIDLEKEA